MSSTVTARRALLGCIYAGLTTGCFYGFGMYSAALKAQFQLSQESLDNINTLPYLLGVTSPIYGPVVRRFGARPTFIIAGALAGGFQMLMWLLATKRLSGGYPALLACNFGVYMGVQLCSGAAFSKPIQYFPSQRGRAMGLVKTFVGLGAAVVSQLYVLVFGPSSDDPKALNCLLLWAAVSFGCCLIGAVASPVEPPGTGDEPRAVLPWLFSGMLLLIVFSAATSLAPAGTVHVVLVPLMLLLALLPVGLLLGWRTEGKPADGEPLNGPPLLATRKSENPNSKTCLQMLGTPDAWLLLLSGSAVIGGGLALATNMAQIVKGAAAGDDLVSTLVTLFAAGNMLGRLCSNVLSDRLVARGQPRPWICAGLCSLMLLSQAAFLLAALVSAAAAKQPLLWFAAAAGGTAFGGTWPHLSIIASELFGSEHLATNYLFYDGLCGSIGSFLFANLIPSFFFDRAAHNGKCVGVSCFGPTHAVLCGLCATGIVAASLLARRSAELYRSFMPQRVAPASSSSSSRDAPLLPEVPTYADATTR